MKAIVVLAVCLIGHFIVATARVLPERFPQFCTAKQPFYNKCSSKVLQKLGPLLVNGVSVIQFPSLTPLEIPLFIVNRNISQNLWIDVVIKNLQIWGFDATIFKSFKFDPVAKSGYLNVEVPFLRTKFEYKMAGKFVGVTLDSEANSQGNFSNIDFLFKFSLKPEERLGVKYYTIDDFLVKSTIGNVSFNITSKDPQNQFSVDAIQNTVNYNPKPFIEAGAFFYEEAATVFFKELAARVLKSIPAEELIPSQ